jgi:hypothetical protein
MSRDDVSGEPDAVIPLTLPQQARLAQRAWAPAYAHSHRASRSAAWLVAACLSGYVSFFLFQFDTVHSPPERVLLAGSMTWVPLSLIAHASSERRGGNDFGAAWRGAWLFLLLDAGPGAASLFDGRQLPKSALSVAAALGIGGVLAVGLRIPNDPSIDWNMVVLEQLAYVRTARGGVPYQALITGHQHAEEVAASWVRRLGYRDARATAAGPDGGIDVASLGAVAQVKYWVNKRVPLKDIQRLAGTAARGQVPLFFARYGYTRPALRWAENPENRVRLFILQSDGNIAACNYLAKRAIWGAPDHVPAEHRRPISYRITFPASVAMLLLSILFGYVAICALVDGHSAWWLVFAFFAFVTIGQGVATSYHPIRKIVKNLRDGKPPDVRGSFTIGVSSDPDMGLPPDAFVGYEPDFALRLFNLIIDLQMRQRMIKRALMSRRRRVGRRA